MPCTRSGVHTDACNGDGVGFSTHTIGRTSRKRSFRRQWPNVRVRQRRRRRVADASPTTRPRASEQHRLRVGGVLRGAVLEHADPREPRGLRRDRLQGIGIVGVEEVDVAVVEEVRVDGHAERPAVAGGGDVVADVDDGSGASRPSALTTRRRPAFSVTNSRPSGARAIAVGSASPAATVTVEKPPSANKGPAPALAGDAASAARASAATSRGRHRTCTPDIAGQSLVDLLLRPASRAATSSLECSGPGA